MTLKEKIGDILLIVGVVLIILIFVSLIGDGILPRKFVECYEVETINITKLERLSYYGEAVFYDAKLDLYDKENLQVDGYHKVLIGKTVFKGVFETRLFKTVSFKYFSDSRCENYIY